MALSLKHGSRTNRVDAHRTETSVTWQGTYSEVITLKESLKIGESTEEFGTLTQIELAQGDGVIWLLTLNYAKAIPQLEIESENEPVEQELSASVISVPIEAHPYYRACWNHYLLGKCEYEGKDYSKDFPVWWGGKTDPLLDPMSEGKNYMWVKNLSETPPATKYVQWAIVSGTPLGAQSNVVCVPTKPGVTSYDKALFVIKETGFHAKKRDAGWATRDLLNSIVDKPLLGDFGLTKQGYNWKVDDIQVVYEGGQWVATRTYTMSGDNKGWDRDLYP